LFCTWTTLAIAVYECGRPSQFSFQKNILNRLETYKNERPLKTKQTDEIGRAGNIKSKQRNPKPVPYELGV